KEPLRGRLTRGGRSGRRSRHEVGERERQRLTRTAPAHARNQPGHAARSQGKTSVGTDGRTDTTAMIRIRTHDDYLQCGVRRLRWDGREPNKRRETPHFIRQMKMN